MDTGKRNRLIESLASQPEPQLVPIQQFFDGNDDLGSIGCNLMEHPGIDAFRTILLNLLGRDDVVDVLAQICELDPGEDAWPFADTVLVVGTISREELAAILAPLQPDEIGSGSEFGAPVSFVEAQPAPVFAAWWD